ncbi:ATPase family AAA domain-containing protein At1g05910-like isoform X2 [Arachis hypogaea]|uniref:ATPase family AAA domain-containing protein At1g05910-like isoform X2 n=1 Tax=Arachis hypogaea TaxID=3818 RepID=UPI003B217115
MPLQYSWSCKRNYKSGYVWCDLALNDIIHPTEGAEYILKGSEFVQASSDPSAKTPEEALVYIFGEARRTTPSILYLPQFDVWWETAHKQLRVVLQTLLDKLPSNMPILLLETSSVLLAEVEDAPHPLFPHCSMYR